MKKNILSYYYKISLLILIFLFLISQLLGCNLAWQANNWPSKICPVAIEIEPYNAKLYNEISKRIPCHTTKKPAYKIKITHKTIKEKSNLSNQINTKINIYDNYFTMSLWHNKKKATEDISIKISNNKYHSFYKQNNKGSTNNETSSLLADEIIRTIQIRLLPSFK